LTKTDCNALGFHQKQGQLKIKKLVLAKVDKKVLNIVLKEVSTLYSVQRGRNWYVLLFLLFFTVLGLELRAFTLSHSTSPIFAKGFLR
jgi:hypothetical protein